MEAALALKKNPNQTSWTWILPAQTLTSVTCWKLSKKMRHHLTKLRRLARPQPIQTAMPQASISGHRLSLGAAHSQ